MYKKTQEAKEREEKKENNSRKIPRRIQRKI